MLTVTVHVWGTKYGLEYVARLAAGVRRHLQQPHRFVVITDNAALVPEGIEHIAIEDPGLLEVKGCFVRLRLFDPDWQIRHGMTERIVSLDLDDVITGPLDVLFNRPENFVIFQGANAANPCPYNGSVFMLRAGAHPEVWKDFSLDAAQSIPRHDFPDDQGWLWHKVPDAAAWKVGAQSGIYGFQKPGWPNGTDLPKDVRIVAFFGWRDPSKFTHLEWVRKNWIAA